MTTKMYTHSYKTVIAKREERESEIRKVKKFHTLVVKNKNASFFQERLQTLLFSFFFL